MKTPIADFVKKYADSSISRLHMPGHKGISFLSCEPYDITEIKGADALYEADGIIAQSEKNATELFDSGRTLFSTEGSSQCIRAMLYLILVHYRKKHTKRPVVIAARNVHKAFIYAASLLDFDVIWIWPEEEQECNFKKDGSNMALSICSCIITDSQVEAVLKEYGDRAAAVYVTSPDYLGGQSDIRKLADICHKYNTLLAVDNAHGAYLHFLQESTHPLDLGADICCDSAHKTLPVLTGGAYLHIGKDAPDSFFKQAKYAMALFGSTSPSYLIMASLDLCNRYLAEEYKSKLSDMIKASQDSRNRLQDNGWRILNSDPLKITIEIPKGLSSEEKADELRSNGIECEYADPDYLVFMVTPENNSKDLDKLVKAMGKNCVPYEKKESLPIAKAEQKMTIREAMFADFEQTKAVDSYGRICRVPTVSCPPAIPVVVPGEIIGEAAMHLFDYYGIDVLDVVCYNNDN